MVEWKYMYNGGLDGFLTCTCHSLSGDFRKAVGKLRCVGTSTNMGDSNGARHDSCHSYTEWLFWVSISLLITP